MKKKRSAYELPFEKLDLSEEEKRQAIGWWQAGDLYHPLVCPVCGQTLVLAPEGARLQCPTVWCSYATEEIPWGIYVAWSRHRKEPQS